jgi:hypothetical protein
MLKYLVLSVVLGSVVFATTAESVYKNSANFFSFDNMSFHVKTTSKIRDKVKERGFFVAKASQQDKSSLLIRFTEPSDIKCTTVLINKKDSKATNYLYFPSLNRTRIVPAGKSGDEILGLGISYDELNQQGGLFEPLEVLTYKGEEYYRVKRLVDGIKNEYIIHKKTNTIRKVFVYKNNVLEKEMIVQKIHRLNNSSLVTKWYIKDKLKNRVITYTIDEDSISSNVNMSLFHKNRLSRCVF